MQIPKLSRRAIALIALLAAAPALALAQPKDPVRIGLVSSKSGVFAQQGEEVLRGVQFAVEEANAKGGIDGRKVEVQIGDDESTPDAGRRVAEKMARDGYNLLIGPIPSSISLALAPNLERWDAAYFVVASKSDKITGDSCKPRVFRTNHSDAMDIAMIGEWAKTFNEKSFATLAADYVWGRDSAESFAKAVKAQGKDVKIQLYAPLGTKDFSPYIAQLKAAKVEAVWVAEVGRDAIAFVKQAQEFGLIPDTKIIGHALLQNFMVDATGKALENMPGNVAYSADIQNPRNQAFVTAFKAKYKRVPTDNEGLAYNGAQVIFEGVRRANSVKPADVAKALKGATLDTIFGSAQMRAADHQLVLANYVGRVKVVDGQLRPAVEQVFPPSLTPPASPLCKM
ncbi:ABC transporter substrate-binding protein [Hydrogenophaga intermedia]|uniref:ABC transporter substrate-binding protein n=1 Tax=Hydrogenophaga intermedia TaxID=65786 RepID=UPI00204452F3|nr:ABC transporter substrate-binding protein [Hydrogenophaga intermedia]MCM3562795.1 ABC transporter substrate-binding protein [Hydrogenophaga intermedia]